MTLKELESLKKDTCYKFEVHNHKRRILGVPKELTVVTGWSAYAGDEALKIAVWYKRYGSWNRANHNFVIPIHAIKSAEFVEDGF
jgi:hypothetical protein